MEIKEGEMVSIIGPSGSGKTTLLNIIGGLSKATSGSVKIGDIEVTSLNENKLIEYRRKMVGHVFQTFNLIPTLTAAENIELPMIAIKIPRNERIKRVKYLLEVVGLMNRKNHKPGELSGGEQQRVALAAALANDPPLILADEPTGELDTANTKIVIDYFSKINKEMNKTIIMVTHAPMVARAANRIFKIEDGKITGVFTPTQFFMEEKAITFVDQLRMRIDDIRIELIRIEEELKAGRISGDDYFKRRLRLTRTMNAYKDELHKLGVII
jgi:putative ABC transport system ATP-binding protein